MAVRSLNRAFRSTAPSVNEALLFIGLPVTRALDYLLIPGAVATLLLNYVAGPLAKLA